jgi:hypothetical protein
MADATDREQGMHQGLGKVPECRFHELVMPIGGWLADRSTAAVIINSR